jgi:hypothetical protein
MESDRQSAAKEMLILTVRLIELVTLLVIMWGVWSAIERVERNQAEAKQERKSELDAIHQAIGNMVNERRKANSQ